MNIPGWKNKNGGGKRPNHLPANLQDDNLKFKVIIDNIDEGVILIDDEGTIQLINPAASAMCGWKADEATNIDVTRVLQLVDDKAVEVAEDDNLLRQIFKSDHSLRADSMLITR